MIETGRLGGEGEPDGCLSERPWRIVDNVMADQVAIVEFEDAGDFPGEGQDR